MHVTPKSLSCNTIIVKNVMKGLTNPVESSDVSSLADSFGLSHPHLRNVCVRGGGGLFFKTLLG